MIRALLALAAVTAVVAGALAASAGGGSGGAVETRRPPGGAPRAPHAKPPVRGQPVAILRRATALLAAPGGARVATLRRRTEFRTLRVLAVTGERRGWLRVIASELPNGRTGWISVRAAKLAASPWRVRADLSQRVVTVRRHGRVVRRFPVAIGRPSTPTPTGRFAVTDKLRFEGGSRAYGWGVLALSGHQTHIEPGWRGGNRLAIHGTASEGTVGSAASFGCLRARRADVRWLVNRVWLGSVVTIVR